MPWLPLAILLIAALTIAALALILFPPGEGGDQVVEGDITDTNGEGTAEDDVAADEEAEVIEDDLSSPPADGDLPLAGEGEEAHPESGSSVGPPPPPGRNLDS